MVGNDHRLHFRLLLLAEFSNHEETGRSDVHPLKGTDTHRSVVTAPTHSKPHPTPQNYICISPIPSACPEVRQIQANRTNLALGQRDLATDSLLHTFFSFIDTK